LIKAGKKKKQRADPAGAESLGQKGGNKGVNVESEGVGV